jgi:hypothetical protein
MMEVEWAILTEKNIISNAAAKTTIHKYIVVNDNQMRDWFLNKDYMQMKTDVMETFQNDRRGEELMVPEEHEKYDQRYDPKDPELVKYFRSLEKVKTQLGQMMTSYYFYLDVKALKVSINMTSGQISRICYDDDAKRFLGIQHNPKTNASKKVELTEEWVTTNFDKDYVEYVRSHSTSKTEYLLVPIGSARTAASQQDIQNNPVIVYQQIGENACAFASLSSSLYYIGYKEEAARLHLQRQCYYNQASLKESHRIMEFIIDIIQEDPFFYSFRAKYSWVKLNRYHNILEQNSVTECDVRWVSLWSEDGGSNHAVSIVGNFIFDGNCTNALPLTRQSLDECCGESSFISIRQGYHFKCKSNIIIESKNAKKRRRKKEKKSAFMQQSCDDNNNS